MKQGNQEWCSYGNWNVENRCGQPVARELLSGPTSALIRPLGFFIILLSKQNFANILSCRLV